MSKTISFSGEMMIKSYGETWAATTGKLESFMRQWGRVLAPLAECAQ